jgi:hypothetical protein
MALAPSADTLVERPFEPQPPAPGALEEWKAAAPWAVGYWDDLEAEPGLDAAIRGYAERAARAVEDLGRAVMPTDWERARSAALARLRGG